MLCIDINNFKYALVTMPATFTLAGQRVSVQCSIGISVSRRADRPLATEDPLREADMAMYRAKSSGRANFVAFGALARMDQLPGGKSICMNVNVSRRELAHPRFFSRIRSMTDQLTVAPSRLRLEITETSVSGPASAPVSGVLHQLKGLGVEIHLDDFGAGLSSLSLLRSLPFDGLKVDRSFLERSNGDVQAITILNAIIALGHSLGKTITVEGVSEPQQVETVLALDGDLAQGYLFGRAIPLEDAIALLGTDFSSRCVAA